MGSGLPSLDSCRPSPHPLPKMLAVRPPKTSSLYTPKPQARPAWYCCPRSARARAWPEQFKPIEFLQEPGEAMRLHRKAVYGCYGSFHKLYIWVASPCIQVRFIQVPYMDLLIAFRQVVFVPARWWHAVLNLEAKPLCVCGQPAKNAQDLNVLQSCRPKNANHVPSRRIPLRSPRTSATSGMWRTFGGSF